MSCTALKDCGAEYTSTGCLVKDARNTVFWLTSDDQSRYKQRVSRADLAIDFADIPKVGEDRDLSLYDTKTGYSAKEIVKTLEACPETSLVCVSGQCRPSTEATARVGGGDECLAQLDGSAMLVDKKSKTFKFLTNAEEGGSPPLFYRTCLRDAPTIADGPAFRAEYAEDEKRVGRSWRQHYCQNAKACPKSADLPVVLSDRQRVLAARETKNLEEIASVCRYNDEVCTLFAPGVTADECRQDPEACARVVLDPQNRCDHFPKGAGCAYRPPKPDGEPATYPYETYAQLLEAYNVTLIVVSVAVVVGVGVMVWRQRRSAA